MVPFCARTSAMIAFKLSTVVPTLLYISSDTTSLPIEPWPACTLVTS